ncbi:LuxR C-terminal-related transcriptional regulator [Streptomyces sp. NPDC048106]|uniref:ATP-binding protein n=1 Tax=Streptomyces sp. NPDC048106 TaxID=3155750 RepID=UPI0034540662
MGVSAIYCVICESRIAAPSTRRTRTHKQYCSNACRQRAYRRRLAATERSTAHPRPLGAATFPVRLDKFTGRARELERLRALSGKRLLTVTGAPGVGKSRLAMQHVQAISADGATVVWLDLDGRGGTERFVDLLATALAPGTDHADEQSLCAALGAQQVLLVLDNCEDVVERHAHALETLLSRCPGLRILATSREAFRIPCETVLGLDPLSLPAPTASTPKALLRSEAGQLFVERASSGNPNFALSRDNAAAVAELCVELDGLPLLIEFAAHWVGLLTVTELLTRIRQSAKALTVGSRTASDRHRSLLSAFASSYDRLSAAEQAVFRRLSVLSGPFGLDLATAVCGEDAPSTQHSAQLLTQLRAKSLLVAAVDSPNGTELRQYGSVRRYAGELLEEAGEAETTRDRLTDWLVDLCRPVVERITVPREPLSGVCRVHHHLRSAVEWTARADDERHVVLVAALARALRARGEHALLGRLGERALHMAADSADRAVLLTELAEAKLAGDFLIDAVAYASRATELIGEGHTGHTADGPRGRRACANPAVRARAFLTLASCLRRIGQHTAAEATARQALAIAQGYGGVLDEAACLQHLAVTSMAAGDLDQASRIITGVLGSLPEYDEAGAVQALDTATDIALAAGEPALAAAHAEELLRRLPDDAGLLHRPLGRLAAALVEDGDPLRALRLAELARALRDQGGAVEQMWLDEEVERRLREFVGRQHPAEVQRVRRAAVTLSPRLARAFALGATWPHETAEERRTGVPSARKLDIARFVAEGLTNSQIASRLGVSPRTVATHLARLRSELDIESRAQVAAWARTALRG